MATKFCKICGKTKDESEFYATQTSSRCKSCTRKINKESYSKNTTGKEVRYCIGCGAPTKPKAPSNFTKPKDQYRCRKCAAIYREESFKNGTICGNDEPKKEVRVCIECGKRSPPQKPRNFKKPKESYRCPTCAMKNEEWKVKRLPNLIETKIGGFWMGNVHYGEYIACEQWKKVNPRTKAFHGYRCVWCGQQVQEGLTGHHVFYEKQACCLADPETGIYYTNLNVKTHREKDYIIGENPNYFVPLCRECHGESNGSFENRAKWADNLRKIVDLTGKCYFVVGVEDKLYYAFRDHYAIPYFGFTGTQEYQEYERCINKTN